MTLKSSRGRASREKIPVDLGSNPSAPIEKGWNFEIKIFYLMFKFLFSGSFSIPSENRSY